MKSALVDLRSMQIVEVYNGLPSSAVLPGVGSVSPVEVGWRGGGEITYQTDEAGKESATEGPPRYAIFSVTEADAPPDGSRVASLSHTIEGDAVKETAAYEEIPLRPEPTAIEKLAAAGLTVAELKALLNT